MKQKILLIVLSALYSCSQLSAQTLDKKFASTNGTVRAIIQSGDTVYIGGDFTQVGCGVKGLARIKPGTAKPDQDFAQIGDNYLNVTAIESDSTGGFYLGGSFSNYNGIPIAPTAILHVLSDGSLDKNFAAIEDYYGDINALKKKDNILYVGGYFNSLQGEVRQNLAALNAITGALINWQPDAPNSTVSKIDASDSLLFINGNFSYVGNISQTSGFAALKRSNGKLITNFPGVDSYVTAFKADNNTLYLGGSFTNIGYSRQGVGKANTADANLNLAFPSTDGNVWCVQPDGKGGYYIGGSFNMVGNLERPNLAHILASGAVDLAFYVNLNGTIYSMATDSTNLYICGDFTNVNGAIRNHVASLSISTSGLTRFNPDANGSVYTIAVNKGTVFMGGSFTTMKGKNRNYVAAVTTSNSLTNWAPQTNAAVNKIVLNDSGTSAYLGGQFTTVKGSNFPYLAKVNIVNGNPFHWSPNPDYTINCMVLDGNILYVKGLFSSFNGTSRRYFAAIDTASGNPTSLKADLNSYYYYYGYGYNDLSINNGKLYIAGNFNSIQDSARTNIARLDLKSGRIDNWNADKSINPNATLLTVNSSRNSVVFGGSFTFLSSTYRNHIAAVDISNGNFKIEDWHPDVLNFYCSDIKDILHYKNDVFACGNFQYDTSTNVNYSGVTIYNIMALNDSTGKISHQFSQYPETGPRSLNIFDNKLMIAGPFSEFANISYNQPLIDKYYLAGYNLSNYQLSSRQYNPNYYDVKMITDKSGNLITAGNFTLLNFVNRSALASIDLNTGLPTSFNPSVDGNVQALAVKDSSLFVGGSYYYISGNYRQNLAAVNSKTGALLPNWQADANSPVYTLAVKDNVLYAGGDFNYIGNTSRNYAAALSTRNGIPTLWNPNLNGAVRTILPVNKWVYLGGFFTSVNGSSRQYLAKVSSGGAHVSAWRPNPDGVPYSIVSSGKTVFVAGFFQTIGSKTRNALAAFDTATNALTAFDAKINSNYAYQGIYPLAAYGKNLYFGVTNSPQAIGDSTRGALAGIDTATKTALSFDPIPDYGFYSDLNNALAAGKNKLFAGGYWQKLGANVSPSYFAVFTLAPQNQTSNLSFTNIQSKSATVNFTPGSGENRLVVIKQNKIPAAPTDGISYAANAAYKHGDSTAVGSYVVYNGNGNSVNITALAPNRSYTISVYEYNGTGTGTDYLTDSVLTGSFITPSSAAPLVANNEAKALTAQISHSKIYPNPAANECTVTFSAQYNGDYTIDVLNVKGDILMRNNIKSIKGVNSFSLKIGNLANGTYLVSIINKNGDREDLKLVKQ